MHLVYKRAAEALDKLHGKRGSLKYIIFNKEKKDTLTFRKRVYALAIETLKREFILVRYTLDIVYTIHVGVRD